jgi:hypothetical protein
VGIVKTLNIKNFILKMKKIISLSVFCFAVLFLQAQNFTLSGYIKDKASGETLIGANISNKAKVTQSAVSNNYGFYSITLPKGKYQFKVSYIGFTDKSLEINLDASQILNIELDEDGVMMQELVVSAEVKDQNVQSTEMGTIGVQMETVKKLPALMGEVDIIKTIQLLPGVKSAGEGGVGFYVRGGGPDQNLILLDEATVYNSGHLLGFFSVFNADAIKNTTLIKGGMPAQYGGRLSSVVDIQMKEGNDKKFGVEGGIGLIASRLTIEGPIQKEKSSFIISARRTYALDLAQPYINTTNFAGTNYYFYDFNAKANYRFSEKDRLYFSAYLGKDVLSYKSSKRDINFDLPYGNRTATLRWNHLFSNRLFMNVSAIYNGYNFDAISRRENFSVQYSTGINDLNAKIDFDFLPNTKHIVKFGTNYTHHTFTPGIATAKSNNVTFSNEKKPFNAHEAAVYVQDDWKISDRVSVNYGTRLSSFTQVGEYQSVLTGKKYEKGEVVKTYYGFEPRISAKFSLSEVSSIKAAVTRNNQYVHLVSNSNSTLPGDIWVPSTEAVKPQIAIQYALGYFQNFLNNNYETSLEVYYKDMKRQIDYREDYVPDAAANLEQEFVFGRGYSYGAELLIRKTKGKLNGWIGYTWSKTDRIFDEINEGNPYPILYDRRHDLSVVANYQINRKWEFGGTFIYSTGNAYTPTESLYFIDNRPYINYGPRNSARIPNYHRMDLSFTYTPKPNSQKRFKSSWNFAVYNAYNRLNTVFTYTDFIQDFDKNTTKATAFKVTIFPIIPSITWNYKWK